MHRVQGSALSVSATPSQTGRYLRVPTAGGGQPSTLETTSRELRSSWDDLQ